MTDRYMKFILTVIAIALTVIASQSLLKTDAATAQAGPVHVYIDGSSAYSLTFAGPIAVKQN